MNFISTLMFSASEVSNLLSFFAIVLCVGAMIMFLVKAAIVLHVHGDDATMQGPLNRATTATSNAAAAGAASATTTTMAGSTMQVPRLKMTRVHIPFTFRLYETGNNSFNEIHLAVSSQINYTLQAFWAVSIRDLHISLWRPWTELQSETHCRTIIDEQHCQLLAANIKNQEGHRERVITLKSPKPALVLGAPPRLAYPLVVFLIREPDNCGSGGGSDRRDGDDDDDTDDQLHPDETVVLINVVHLRDPVCPLPTSILAQYLKQASGQLSCLKQLYLAAGDSLSNDEQQNAVNTSSSSSSLLQQPTGSLSFAEPVACAGSGGPLLCSDGPQTEQLCIVCHYFPLSRALLPCRHTCICAVCFSKLERCPMCRAPINSYFCIRSEEYVPPGAIESRLPKTKGTVHWLDSLNDRLTDFLGFR